jgi:hypothetical protein
VAMCEGTFVTLAPVGLGLYVFERETVCVPMNGTRRLPWQNFQA